MLPRTWSHYNAIARQSPRSWTLPAPRPRVGRDRRTHGGADPPRWSVTLSNSFPRIVPRILLRTDLPPPHCHTALHGSGVIV